MKPKKDPLIWLRGFQFIFSIVLSFIGLIANNIIQNGTLSELKSYILENFLFFSLLGLGPVAITYCIEYFAFSPFRKDLKPILLFKTTKLFFFTTALYLIFWSIFFASPLEGANILLWASESIIISASTITVSMLLLRQTSIYIYQLGKPQERILVLGHNIASQAFIHAITKKKNKSKCEIVAVFEHEEDKTPEATTPNIFHIASADNTNSLREVCQKHGITTMAIALTQRRDDNLLKQIYECRQWGIRVEEIPKLYELITYKTPIFHIEKDSISFDGEIKIDAHRAILNRAYNIFFSTILLIIYFTTIFPIMCLLMKIFMPGPIFFTQKRVGLFDSVFTIYKIRTMSTSQEIKNESSLSWAQDKDPRINWLGKILRDAKLDEFPQLLNVIKGEMNIVGPRPQMLEIVNEFEAHVPYYSRRHLVRPGMSGWAQINHKALQSKEDVLEALQYDLYYAKNKSFTFDLYIVYRTFTKLILNLPR